MCNFYTLKPILSFHKVLFFFLFLLFNTVNLFAVTVTTSGSGNWSSTTPDAPWPGGTIPATTDDIIIGNGFTLTVDGNRTCNSIAFGSASGTLTVNNTFTLTVTTSVKLNSSNAASTACTISGAGAISCATFAVGGVNVEPTATPLTSTMTFTLATLTVSGTFTLTSSYASPGGGKTNNAVFNFESGTISITGALTTSNENGANTSTFNMNTGSTDGILNLSVSPSISATGTNTITLGGGSQTVNYNGSGAQNAIGTTYNILKINNSAGVSLSAAATVTILTIGDVTANSIFLDNGKQVTSTGTLNLVSGTFVLGRTTTATTYPAFAANNISSGTTVEYGSTLGAQTISNTPLYYNLTCSGAGTKTFNGSATVTGDYTQTAGTVNLNNGATSNNLTVNGNFSISAGTFALQNTSTGTGATVTVEGSTGTTISGTAKIEMDGGGAAAGNVSIFQTTNLTASSSSSYQFCWGDGATTKINECRISGNFTQTVGSSYVEISGVSKGGYFFNGDGSTQTLSYSGTAALYTDWTVNSGAYVKLATNLTLGANSLCVFTVNGTLDCSTYTVNGGATVGAFTLASGGTLKTANINGIVSTTVGSVSTSVVTRTFNNAANYIFYGTANQNTSFPNTTMNNLTINNTGTAGNNTVTLNTVATINGILTLTQGIVAASAAANIITIANTATTAVVGGSNSAPITYISAAFQRVLPANLSSSSNEYIFPVGKATAGVGTYYPFSLTTLTTGATGPTIKVEAFSSDAGGTADGTTVLTPLSTTEYWSASVAAGNYTTGSVSLTRQTALSPLTVIARSATQGGTYASLGGTVSGMSIITSDLTGSSLNFFVMATCPCSDPTTQASAITFSNLTTTSMTVSWTRGATPGDGVIVLIHSAAAVDSDPVDGTSYTASSVSPFGTQIGTGNYVVYLASGTSVNITGLTANTVYYYKVYEKNCAGVASKYNTTSVPSGSQTTMCNEPTTQASSVVFSGTAATSMTVSWTRGGTPGDGVIVLIHSGAAVDADPVDGTAYTASAASPFGTQIGTGNYVVYVANGTSVILTGLTASTTYYFRVYEKNCYGAAINYYLTSAATGNNTTLAASTETCFDNIRNQDETSIDCGGTICVACNCE